MMIPFYIALSPQKFEELEGSSVEDRSDFLFEAMEQDPEEAAEIPVVDVDKFFDEIQEAIARETGDADLAGAAVFGKLDWDGEGETDGMRINHPDEVARVAQALSALNEDVVNDVPNMSDLVNFYDEAAKRGDAIGILFN